MKRYLLFCGENYYPYGGWEDFKDSFDTIEECRMARTGDWYQIIDTETWKTCKSKPALM